MKNDNAKDRDRTLTLGDTRSMNTASTGTLGRLGELDDYKIADGEPDIRGWDVKAADGRKIGEVSDLLVDTGALKVRYVEVKLDDDAAEAAARADGGTSRSTDATRYRLVPIGIARLDDEHDDVCLTAQATQMAGVPAYDRGPVSREYETGLLRGYDREITRPGASGPADSARVGGMASSPDDFYSAHHFDDSTFFGSRRTGRTATPYLSRMDR